MAQSIHTISLLHTWIGQKVTEGAFCIDATAGKGKDTALLAELAGPGGKVVAMDIQADAIEQTAAFLQKLPHKLSLYRSAPDLPQYYCPERQQLD